MRAAYCLDAVPEAVENAIPYILAALTEATEQQKRDGERLDWLASDKRSMEELHTIMAYQGKYMREEIDAAMSKEESL